MSTTTTSTTGTTGADVADDAADGPTGRARVYLAEVRHHLADLSSLPDDERDDLLDELAAHVREVAAADDRPLDEVLGTPRAFAVELLASAGLAPGERPRAGLPARAARAGRRLRGLATTAAEHPWARSVAAFLPELRPAWWVARGCLVVYAVWILGAGDDLSTFPLPEIMGSRLVGTVALVAAAVASVRLARRTPAPRWRWVANTAGVLAALVVVVNASTFRQTVFIDDGNPSYGPRLVPTGELTHPDGTPITNIRAYDAEGRPIDRVRLYDQNGRPIEPGASAGVPWDESMPPGVLGEGDTLTRRGGAGRGRHAGRQSLPGRAGDRHRRPLRRGPTDRAGAPADPAGAPPPPRPDVDQLHDDSHH